MISRMLAARLAVLALAVLLLVAVAPAMAAQIPATSAEGFPNGRTSSDPPSNAIDGSASTFTWTTEANNTVSPSFLAIGFSSTQVNRLRILKTNASGGGTGTGVKNLVIQYTTGSGSLASRSWSNVPNLQNGFGGSELLTASLVFINGTVSMDNHNGGFASLTFDTVQATGLRIGFSNITATGSCSSNPDGPCNHYRVAEFQAHFEASIPPPPPLPPVPGFPPPPQQPAVAAVPAGGTSGQPKILGPPLFRIIGVGGIGFEHKSGADGVTREPQLGWLLGVGDRVTARGSVRINGGAEIKVQAIPSGAIYTWKGAAIPDNGAFLATPAVFDVDHVLTLVEGSVAVDTTGMQTQARSTQAGGGAVILTPVARAEVNGVARLSHDPRRRRSTIGNVRGSVNVTPSNPSLRGVRLTPGRQVDVTASGITAPFDLVPNLATTIPSPRTIRSGPTVVTAPSKLSLRSLKRSKCVAVAVSSTRAARVLVTIFSGRRSVRLFGQRLVIFTAAARKSTCITVPARAKTFNVRTPLKFATGYALGATGAAGQRPPVIRPIALIP